MVGYSFLSEDGKFNISAIMKHAHVLKAYRRFTLSAALKEAWFLAKRQRKQYREAQEDIESYEPVNYPNRGNVLKALFVGSHPEYTNYDSSWK